MTRVHVPERMVLMVMGEKEKKKKNNAYVSEKEN